VAVTARTASASETGCLVIADISGYTRAPSPGRPAPYSIASRVLRYVSSPTTIPFTGACTCSRAAVLTTSPATIDSPYSGRAPSAAGASPVFTAI
jgi:hypothetical protein